MTSETDIRSALREVMDPELGINIVDLGLVYGVAVDGAGVRLAMTMTNPACPLLEFLKGEVTETLTSRFPGLNDVTIDIVWDPPWHPDMMTDAARAQLDGGR